MRRSVFLLSAVLMLALGAALIARAGGSPPTTQFRTPDAGAACRLEGRALVCSSLESAGSVALRSTGLPAGVRALPWWDASTHVLRNWQHGSISCRLSGATIACTSPGGAILVSKNGFAVSG
jgi:hypothetical protein